MKSFSRVASICFVTLIVNGCGSGSGSNSGILEEKTGLTSFGKEGLLNVGNTVKAISRCIECDNIEYKWVFDNNKNGKYGDSVLIDGVLVSDTEVLGDTYTLKDGDFGVKVKLEVQYRYDNLSKSEYLVYQPSIVNNIFSTNDAFAVHKTDNSVVSWRWGLVYTLKDIQKVFEGDFGFAAIQTNGEFVTWGASQLPDNQEPIFDVVKFYANQGGAYAALKNDGGVVTWGDSYSGGDSSKVQEQLINVKSIYSSKNAFSALKNDKTVVSWGDSYYGGDNSNVSHLLVGVEKITENEKAFAAIKDDNTVVTWGALNFGGYSDHLSAELFEVSSVFSNRTGFSGSGQDGTDFISVKKDGEVIAWGADVYSSSSALSRNQTIPNATSVFTTWSSYAVLTSDGKVETWGENETGGDSSAVRDKLNEVETIASNANAFSALKSDGSIVNWGNPGCGGNNISTGELNDVIDVIASECAFVAIRKKGKLTAWGESGSGGDIKDIENQLTTTKSLKSSNRAFITLQDNGQVFTWGDIAPDNAFTADIKKLIEPTDHIVESSF